MIQILHWKDYTEKGLKTRLMKVYDMSEEGAGYMIETAKSVPARVIKSTITGAMIKCEAEDAKLKWYLLV
ncbi:MAG: hypothetical protein ABIH42_04250 [Planctomycetota bacterium]